MSQETPALKGNGILQQVGCPDGTKNQQWQKPISCTLHLLQQTLYVNATSHRPPRFSRFAMHTSHCLELAGWLLGIYQATSRLNEWVKEPRVQHL